MRILSIETSCDETAVSIVETTGDFPLATYEILGNQLYSQIALHAEYGGVFPMLAKREHGKALVPLMTTALEEAELLLPGTHTSDTAITAELTAIFDREPVLHEMLTDFTAAYREPEIDLIAVTVGPGLEPALWVGVTFAKALAALWNKKVVAVNHMEGHVLASLYNVVEDNQLAQINFPAISLLISGGHTELLLMKNWGQYEKIGQTRDDAVGEAFDKVARLMDLPYPGGPELSKLAALGRKAKLPPFKDELPRPMIHSGDLDFSFSGLKTAVRYAVEDKELSDSDKQALARDFEDAVTEVIVKKTSAAVAEHGAQSLIVGGGVSANGHIRTELNKYFLREHPDCELYFPAPGLSTDNSIMIALAGHAHAASASNPAAAKLFKAEGKRSIANA
jgi:N6-L-threonylcarbamoyladenine synthase